MCLGLTVGNYVLQRLSTFYTASAYTSLYFRIYRRIFLPLQVHILDILSLFYSIVELKMYISATTMDWSR